MNGARDQVFADSAFAAQKNGRAGGRDAFYSSKHFLHLGTDGDDVGMAVFLSQGFAERAIFFAQTGVVQLLVHHHPHFGEGKRFEDVVAGAGFHRLDRGLHRAERGHDDDGQRGILAFRGLQKFKPVHAGKFKVSENEVDWLGSEQLQSSFGVAGRERLEPIVAQV